MKHTRKEHLAMAAALREAIPYLWDGVGKKPAAYERFICRALNRCEATYEAAYLVKVWVLNQLEGCLSIGGWLLKTGLGTESDTPKLQATRLAWMHHMIEVLEKE